MNEPHLRKSRAFTLVELLVTSVITLVIVGLVLQCFSLAQSSWRRNEQRIDTFRSARAALDVMARDLRAVALTPTRVRQPGDAAHTDATALSGTSSSVPSLVLDYALETPEADRFNEEAYALTLLPNSGKSSLCAVGYHSVWNDKAKVYSLRRLYRNSDATFGSFREAAFKSAGFPGFGDLYSRKQAVSDELLGCAWDVSFRPSEGGEPAKLYPRKSYTTSLPSWVEIRFKAASPTAVQSLAAVNADRSLWRQPDSVLYKKHVFPHAQQFVLRVKLETGSDL
jgi:type II secretory pathway pseudopilin PulG